MIQINVDETTYENIHIDSDHSDGVDVNSYKYYENIHIDSDHSDGVDDTTYENIHIDSDHGVDLMKIYILIQY